MIPVMNIVAWGQTVPWADQRQVEQDLIICRALVALFSDPFLAKELRFRGGTALNKLHFPEPLRYSEDIDLARTSPGPLGPVLDATRAALEPWLGHAKFDPSKVATKLRFRVKAETSQVDIPLKVEINWQENTAYDPPRMIPFEVKNPWFSGKAEIPTFSNEEILATKLRALLQREKGRDLIDLANAKAVFKDLNVQRVIELFRQYLDASGKAISRAQAEQRMFAKLANSTFMADVKPYLPAEEAARFDDAAAKTAFRDVFSTFIRLMPGAAWARTAETAKRLGVPEVAKD
jgi:predicted nucleotidyltransferase component of viral defense system